MTDATLELVQELVRIPSVNPALVAGAAGESGLANFLAAWGEARGLAVHRLDDPPERPSVVLIARGRGGGRSLMLNGHLDTVGTDGMAAPFTPRLEDGRLYGRGALDMKAGLACSLSALDEIRGLGLRGDVLLAAVADEEHASVGTAAVLRRFGADAAVVTEPTDLQLHLAHRGFVVSEVTTFGRASHTSQPQRGVNAVAHMGRVLTEIEAQHAALRARAPHPLADRGSAQAVAIAGGEEWFVTPARCRLTVERRTVPGERLPDVEDDLTALLKRAGAGEPDFRAEARTVLAREPFEIAEDAEVVQLLRAAVMAARGGVAPAIAGAPYWTDAALIEAAGIPTVLFGPAGRGMHAADEQLEVASLEPCRAALVGLARAFCS